MKTYLSSRIILVSFIISLFGISNLFAQNGTAEKNAKLKAAQGDTVWIILNHVKEDKRDQFEKFSNIMFNAFEKALNAGKLSEREIKSLENIRFLKPFKQNKDSSFTYIFLADPRFMNVKGSASYYLKKIYTEEETKKYAKMFTDCFAKPQEGYMVLQSNYFLQ